MDADFHKVELERVQIGVEAMFSNDLLGMKAKVTMDEMIGHHIRVQMRGFLWGRTIQRHRARYPQDWVEALKERFAPAWLCRRWPIKYLTIDFNLKAIYPTLRYEVPKHEPRLVLFTHGSIMGGYDATDVVNSPWHTEAE